MNWKPDIRILWIACVLLVCVVACRFDQTLINEREEEPFRIVRFDQLVDDYVATGNIVIWQRLNMEYPRQTRVLIERVLRLGSADTEGIEDSLRLFYGDPILVQVRMDVARRFADLSAYEAELDQAFRRLQEEVPDFVRPRVYSQISAFNQSIVVGDSLLGISLDKYLGADYPAYQKYFYENQRASMEAARIVQDCLLFYLHSQYPYRHAGRPLTLGEALINQGRVGWVVCSLIGKKPIDVAAYQPATKAWYAQHEANVWQVLRRPQVWDSTDSLLVHSVVMSADAHPYFTDVHSRGVGFWIGMRLVESYMKNHPEVTLDSLLHLRDYDRVLRESHYLTR